MGLIADLREAAAFAREQRALNRAAKGVSPTDPTIKRIFGWQDRKRELTQPYTQLPVVYACVQAIARNIATVPFKLYQDNSDEPVESGQVWWLFDNVNPYTNKYQLWEGVVTNLQTKGEAFIVLDGQRVQGVPVAMWLLPPEDMHEKLDGAGRLQRWEYRGSKASLMIDPELVIHIKLWNPNNAIRGLSPLAALKISNEASFKGYRLNNEAFDNDTLAGTVFSTDQTLNNEQFERMHYELTQRNRGLDQAGQALLLEGGVKAQQARVSNKDMQFLELMGFSREDVMMVFKVPKSEIGLDDEVNRATAGTSAINFVKKTLIPIMTLIQEEVNKRLLSQLGLEGRFDVESIDILNAETERKAQAARTYYDMGVPFDVINDRLALGFPQFPGSSEPRTPTGGPQATPSEPALDEEGEDTTRAAKTSQRPDMAEMLTRYRDVLWKAITRPLHGAQGRFTTDLRNYFKAGYDKAAKRLTRGTAEEALAALGEDAVWDEVLSPAKLQGLAEGHLAEAVAAGADVGARQRRRQFEDDNLLRTILMRRTVEITSIRATVREALTKAIRDMIARAGEEGWTEEERKRAVENIVSDNFNNGSRRSRTIARTELFGAFNEAEWGTLNTRTDRPTHKEWINSRDTKVRDEHNIDGEIVAWEQPFSNGLMHPMDPAGAPENVINCRCVMNPLWLEGEEA